MAMARTPRWLAVSCILLAIFPQPVVAQQSHQPQDRSAKGTELRPINIGLVRHAFGPWAARIADGGFDISTGRDTRWYPHDTDATIVAALSAGRLHIGLIGAGVAASAIARGLDLKIFYVLGSAAETECLAVLPETEPTSEPQKWLIGKVVAVPFGSTPHYRLLESLRLWGANPSAMRIVNLQVPQIAGAWKRREIDVAVASEPQGAALEPVGRCLPLPTADKNTGLMVLSAVADFYTQHLVFLSRLIDVMSRAQKSYEAGGSAPAEDGADIKSIATVLGLAPSTVGAKLNRYQPPPLADQASSRWLDGGKAAGLLAQLREAVDVWRWAGRLQAKDIDLAAALAPDPARMALGYKGGHPR